MPARVYMYTHKHWTTIWLTMLLLIGSHGVSAQVLQDSVPVVSLDTLQVRDSLQAKGISNDSSITQTDSVAPKKKKKDNLDSPVKYTAKDSIVLLANGTAMLHGDSKVNYQSMELNSAFIRVKMDSSTVYASGVKDSTDEWVGKPVFKDKSDTYESNEITYNMKTKKGYIRNVVTEQGEGYVVADKTKKSAGDEMMMAGGKYTTCNQHEHPHFYLQMTKAKVKPGDYIASGPAYMVVGDVPVPLAIPFGYFPFTNTYSSGLIMPSFGDDYSRGLYLMGIGYYFAISDYMDLELTGDIYTKGTWAVYGKSRYIKRYKFRGNIDVNYRWDATSERGMPDYSVAKNLKVVWTHQQDAKANPYSSFSASVNFSTSGYNRSDINSYYNARLNSENTKSSSINYTQRFPNSPWSISLSALLSQQTRDSSITATLPDLSVTMSSVYPFKKKQRVGKEKWYEKIKLSYTGSGKIAVNNIKESEFFKSDFLRDWQTGLRHSIPISASWMAFKYLSITPSITLNDRMYFTRIDQKWNEDKQALQRDTTKGFYNVFDFNVALSLSTKIYTFFIPSRKLFGDDPKVDRFRHVLTPSISFSYHPDFGKKFWGYYGSYDQALYADSVDAITGMRVPRMDENGQPMYMHQVYSRYSNGMYGNASQGLCANLHFSLQNNIEVKVRNDKDTTGENPYKVYSVIDNLGITGGYNFAADSMNFENFGVQLRLKIPVVDYTINLSGQFDPYMYELNAAGNPVRTNKQYWHHGKFPHFLGTNMSFSYTFDNQKIHKWFHPEEKDKGQDAGNMDPVTTNDDGSISNGKREGSTQNEMDGEYVKTEIPWSLTVNYSISYTQVGGFDYKRMYPKMGIVQTLSFSGTIGLGKGWKASATTNIDLQAKQFSYTNFSVSRDLHCWNMSASFVPFGPYKNYTFHIGVNASMLRDLKYDKSNTGSTNERVHWW